MLGRYSAIVSSMGPWVSQLSDVEKPLQTGDLVPGIALGAYQERGAECWVEREGEICGA